MQIERSLLSQSMNSQARRQSEDIIIQIQSERYPSQSSVLGLNAQEFRQQDPQQLPESQASEVESNDLSLVDIPIGENNETQPYVSSNLL